MLFDVSPVGMFEKGEGRGMGRTVYAGEFGDPDGSVAVGIPVVVLRTRVSRLLG